MRTETKILTGTVALVAVISGFGVAAETGDPLAGFLCAVVLVVHILIMAWLVTVGRRPSEAAEPHCEAAVAVRYEHDCDLCTTLGEWHEFDLYFCTQGGSPTVIARYGTDEKYLSGLDFVIVYAPLVVAAERARAKGLLP